MTSNDNLYRFVKASKRLPDKNGYYFIRSVWGKDIWNLLFWGGKAHWFNRNPEWDEFEWLEKIEADQQDLWDDVKIAFAKDIAAILSGVNSEPVNVNEIISKYFLIPKQ